MRRILIGPAALVIALALAGCTAQQSSTEGIEPASMPPSTQFGSGGGGVIESEALPEGAADAGAGIRTDGALGAADVDREVVTTGSMTVTADDPIEAAGEATAIVERAGGRIDARRETAPTDFDEGSAMLTVRVPAESLGETIDELKQLGQSQSVALDEVDVTTQSQDLAARIGASRASLERLTALLATATDVEVLIQLETAISDRQGALESMEAQQRSLADQVSLSSIDLYLVSPEDAPTETPDTFWSGLVAGWTAFTGFAAFLLVAAGVLLPWLVVAAVLAAIAVLVVKRMRRRARGTAPVALDPTPAPTRVADPAATPAGTPPPADD